MINATNFKLIFVFGDSALDSLMNDRSVSPEEFLIDLEDRLESGELTIDEVQTLLQDYSTKL